MTRRRTLPFLLLAAVGVASASSHLLARFLGISSNPVTWEHFGSGQAEGIVSPLGSSLLYYGLDWNQITKAADRPAERWRIPAASPCELEATFGSVTNVRLSVIGISLYDLNEHFLGPNRAALVPLGTTLRDLWTAEPEWAFAKRVLAEYPLAYSRRIFPTAGRSETVMVSVRETLRRLRGRPGAGEDRITFDPSRVTFQRVSDWEGGRLLRNLSTLRRSCRGEFEFGGPKRLALERMLREAARRGPVQVVVLPVSPAFAQEFINTRIRRDFERVIEQLAHAVPSVQWIRVDRIPELQSDRFYWDLIHLNVEGQTSATRFFLDAAGDSLKHR